MSAQDMAASLRTELTGRPLVRLPYFFPRGNMHHAPEAPERAPGDRCGTAAAERRREFQAAAAGRHRDTCALLSQPVRLAPARRGDAVPVVSNTDKPAGGPLLQLRGLPAW